MTKTFTIGTLQNHNGKMTFELRIHNYGEENAQNEYCVYGGI